MLLLPARAIYSFIIPKTESKTEECANHCSRENSNKEKID